MLNIGWKQRSGVRSHHINRTRERKKDGLGFCSRKHWLSAANCLNFFNVRLQAVGAISFFNYITVMSCWPRPGPAFWTAGWSAVRNSAHVILKINMKWPAASRRRAWLVPAVTAGFIEWCLILRIFFPIRYWAKFRLESAARCDANGQNAESYSDSTLYSLSMQLTLKGK